MLEGGERGGGRGGLLVAEAGPTALRLARDQLRRPDPSRSLLPGRKPERRRVGAGAVRDWNASRDRAMHSSVRQRACLTTITLCSALWMRRNVILSLSYTSNAYVRFYSFRFPP